VSKVSQKVTALPSCKPQFPATGPGGGFVGVDPPPEADPVGAEQLAVVPPLEPPQLHVHGPAPATDDAVPAVQSAVEGLADAVAPFADPHAPFTGAELAFTTTVALAAGDVPPLPVQASPYVVVVVGDAAKVPLIAFVPVQPPEALHEVALVDDQVTTDTLPDVMLVGLAENDTVGAGVLPPAFPPPVFPPEAPPAG
jgi:hypothetical protein